jgi:hypothetical protein
VWPITKRVGPDFKYTSNTGLSSSGISFRAMLNNAADHNMNLRIAFRLLMLSYFLRPSFTYEFPVCAFLNSFVISTFILSLYLYFMCVYLYSLPTLVPLFFFPSVAYLRFGLLFIIYFRSLSFLTFLLIYEVTFFSLSFHFPLIILLFLCSFL